MRHRGGCHHLPHAHARIECHHRVAGDQRLRGTAPLAENDVVLPQRGGWVRQVVAAAAAYHVQRKTSFGARGANLFELGIVRCIVAEDQRRAGRGWQGRAWQEAREVDPVLDEFDALALDAELVHQPLGAVLVDRNMTHHLRELWRSAMVRAAVMADR